MKRTETHSSSASYRGASSPLEPIRRPAFSRPSKVSSSTSPASRVVPARPGARPGAHPRRPRRSPRARARRRRLTARPRSPRVGTKTRTPHPRSRESRLAPRTTPRPFVESRARRVFRSAPTTRMRRTRPSLVSGEDPRPPRRSSTSRHRVRLPRVSRVVPRVFPRWR